MRASQTLVHLSTQRTKVQLDQQQNYMLILCACFGCLLLSRIQHLFLHFIWQSHLTSISLSVEKSPEHKPGQLGAEKYTSFITDPKCELNEFQPHAGFIEMRQGQSPVVQKILILLSKAHRQLFLLELFCLSHCTAWLLYQMGKGSHKQQATS